MRTVSLNLKSLNLKTASLVLALGLGLGLAPSANAAPISIVHGYQGHHFGFIWHYQAPLPGKFKVWANQSRSTSGKPTGLEAMWTEFATKTHSRMPFRPGVGSLSQDFHHPRGPGYCLPGGPVNESEEDVDSEIAETELDVRSQQSSIPPAVPEPGSLALLCAGALGLWFFRRTA